MIVMTHIRYALLILSIMISTYVILNYAQQRLGDAEFLHVNPARLQYGVKDVEERLHMPFPEPSEVESYLHTEMENQVEFSRRKANATFVVLARNQDLEGVVSSMKQMEDRFNRVHRYPWVFLNEVPFSDEFKLRTQQLTDAEVSYGLIPDDHWYQPDHIDEERASAARDEMEAKGILYGGSVPYRNMCRFNSGFFFRHELLQKYRYYWRVEPSVNFYCDLHDDPFLTMSDNNKVYGFTLAIYEYESTVPSLWNAVREFAQANPELIAKDNALAFLSDDDGYTYNYCHFWSNFEIGDLDFWRNETYMKFFDFLDQKGGFYYERWGDAPIHSIGAALFARKDQIHFFDDIGYFHDPFTHCPQGASHTAGKCWCDPKATIDHKWYSCLNKYEALFTQS